jgi:nicotinate-nucleotide adenylyltransferase
MTALTGLFGGAFDPPHNGHVALAEDAIQHFGLERLVVLPVGIAPHKGIETDAGLRLELTRAAFADRPKVEVSDHDVAREGPAYTVDTVRWAAGVWGAVIFLVGADEFGDFLHWKDPDEILEHARLGVATRPGHPQERLDRVLAGLRHPDRVDFFTIEPLPISATQIRARAARGEPVDGLVPAPVSRLIAERKLYARDLTSAAPRYTGPEGKDSTNL